MLNKLIKYEIKATARIFIPLYLCLIVFSIISRLVFFIPDEGITLNIRSIIGIISMVVFYTLMIGIQVMTIVVLVQRFYKNLLCDEGYLMFTLPVDTWKHIVSKLTAAMIWVVLSVIIALISFVIIMPGEVSKDVIQALQVELNRVFNYCGPEDIYYLAIEAIVICVLTIASSILMVYGAIALGQLFSKYKLLASFGMYIGLKTIAQLIGVVFMIVLINILSKVDIKMPSSFPMQTFFLLILIYTIIITIGCFLLTKFILKNKLNLE